MRTALNARDHRHHQSVGHRVGETARRCRHDSPFRRPLRRVSAGIGELTNFGIVLVIRLFIFSDPQLLLSKDSISDHLGKVAVQDLWPRNQLAGRAEFGVAYLRSTAWTEVRVWADSDAQRESTAHITTGGCRSMGASCGIAGNR